VEDTVVQFLEKVKLIASIHEDVLLNVEQAQKKQRSTYAHRAGNTCLKDWWLGSRWLK
jgi:hypothetical protein